MSTPPSASKLDSSLFLSIGQKAIGLLRIPEPWRPPFFVLPTDVYASWQNGGAAERNRLAESSSAAIVRDASKFGVEWNGGLILRSSAVTESLNDRGAYDSRPLSADFDQTSVENALTEIYTQFSVASPEDHLAVAVQPFIPGPRRYIGHASNERRVSKTVNQWMLECADFERIERFNSQRSEAADYKEKLTATNYRGLLNTFKSVGRWCTDLGIGPCHIEWAWSNETVWLLQLDFEDESPDDGIDPRSIIRAADVSECSTDSAAPLIRVKMEGALTGWGKIDKVRDLAAVRTSRYPDLYYLPATEFGDAVGLAISIQTISNGRAVCRTDCNCPKIEKLNLPRTHSVSPSDAVAFIAETTEALRNEGAVDSDICFILHRFIPATASAWTLADPSSQIVRVDSLWGIPDGLQFLPHDTFEYDVKRGEITSQTIRYKVSCIQETETGSWEEKKIARRYGRTTSLASADVREIASQSFDTAKKLNQRIQIMWFCGIPTAVGIGKNLPWFRMAASDEKAGDVVRSVGPIRNRFRVQNQHDLVKASALDAGKYVLSVQPNVDLIRDDRFLAELAAIALRIAAPVELYGSILGHAYYMLRRANVTVIASGEPQYTRVRGKQVFAKLVRDEIPSQIERHGETTVLARISKHESRPALIVKLFEEANELLRAGDPMEVEAELADLLEVIRSLASATGVSWEDVQAASEKKREQRGGFDRGVVLMETSWPKSDAQADHPLTEIPLKNLGQVREFRNGADLNFASLLAKGGNSTFTALEAGSFKVSLTSTGLRVERVGPETLPEQLEFPGFDNSRV